MFSYLPPILNRMTWGVHINSERYFAPPPGCPDWLTSLQKQDWQDRGVVVWEANFQVVAHLYAGYTLKLLQNMREPDTWKTNGFIVGSPAYQIRLNTKIIKQSEETDNELPKENWILRNKIELSPDRAADLFTFLTAEEESLEQIAADEDRAAREALGRVYRLIDAYARKIREAKQAGTVAKAP